MTLSFLRKGKEAITLGREANPTVLKLITGSDDIQVDSVRESIKFRDHPLFDNGELDLPLFVLVRMIDILFLNSDQLLCKLDRLISVGMVEKMLYNLCVYLITTLLRNFADKGESHTPALNVIMVGDLLTTIAITSNLLGTFRFDGDRLQMWR